MQQRGGRTIVLVVSIGGVPNGTVDRAGELGKVVVGIVLIPVDNSYKESRLNTCNYNKGYSSFNAMLSANIAVRIVSDPPILIYFLKFLGPRINKIR